MGKPDRIHEFAARAGVTARALRHYDRLGLLRPRRSEAGYRLYAEDDLARLEQIVALRFLGLPLRRIGRLLESGPLPMAEALRAQRAALAAKRKLLDRALAAIEDAERVMASGATSNAATLRRLIEVIEMQNDSTVMERYFSDEAWKRMTQLHRRRRRPRGGLSAAWRTLFGEAEGMLGEDPASARAQRLGARWMRLWEGTTGGDAGIRSGLSLAWADRENWPPDLRAAWADVKVPEIGDFITRVLALYMRRYYTARAWAKKATLDRSGISEDWQALFGDVRRSLEDDPRSKKGLDLAQRWRRLAERSTGGDRGIKAGMMKAWKDRRHWPLPMRQHVEEGRLPEIEKWIGKAMRELRKR
jgi:MerR family transcriptional regulator, thiopeptide resistance regulator